MIKAEIKDLELIEHLKKLPQDEMAVFVMADGRIRGAFFHGTRFVNQARVQHNLGILETMIFGQAILSGALMLPLMKGKEYITLRYEGNGPAEGFSVEVDSSGTVRGFLFNEHILVEKPLENWDLKPFLGSGTLSVSTIHEGDKNPYTSSVPVDSGNIAQDLASFYNQSEQLSTAFNTGIQLDKKGRVIGAGGLFLQIMPEIGGKRGSGATKNSSADKNADSELISRAEMAFKTAPSIGQWFSEGGTIEDLVYGLFREFKPSIVLTRNVTFDCRCSKENYIKYIRNLPKDQLDDIKKDTSPLVVSCRNCGSVYKIPVSDI